MRQARTRGLDAILDARSEQPLPIRSFSDDQAKQPSDSPAPRPAFPTVGGWFVRLGLQGIAAAIVLVACLYGPPIAACADAAAHQGLYAASFGQCSLVAVAARNAAIDQAIKMWIRGSGR